MAKVNDQREQVELVKNLTDVQAKKLDETDKMISKVETNLIDNEVEILQSKQTLSKTKVKQNNVSILAG